MKRKEGRTIGLYTKVSPEEKELIAKKMALLGNVSNNVNQIARRTNETRNLYAEDMEDIRQGYLAVWKQIGKLMDKLEI